MKKLILIFLLLAGIVSAQPSADINGNPQGFYLGNNFEDTILVDNSYTASQLFFRKRYNSLALACQDAQAGAVIIVDSGNYSENREIIITKSITVTLDTNANITNPTGVALGVTVKASYRHYLYVTINGYGSFYGFYPNIFELNVPDASDPLTQTVVKFTCKYIDTEDYLASDYGIYWSNTDTVIITAKKMRAGRMFDSDQYGGYTQFNVDSMSSNGEFANVNMSGSSVVKIKNCKFDNLGGAGDYWGVFTTAGDTAKMIFENCVVNMRGGWGIDNIADNSPTIIFEFASSTFHSDGDCLFSFNMNEDHKLIATGTNVGNIAPCNGNFTPITGSGTWTIIP